MNDIQSAGPITVLLTTDNTSDCAEALLHLYGSQMPDDTDLVVICHGTDAKAVADMVHAAGAYPGAGRGAVTITDLSRMQSINSVIAAMASEGELRHAVILDQTIRMAPGWVQGLSVCLAPAEIHGLGGRVMTPGSVGFVGPCTDQTHNDAQRISLQEHEVEMGLTTYAATRLTTFAAGMVSIADVLDGACVLVSAQAIAAVSAGGDLLNVDCGEWAWTDLAIRAAKRGYGCVVSEQVFVGRADVIPMGSQKAGDICDRLACYARHTAPDEHLVVAMMLVRLTCWQDLQLLRASIGRLSSLVEGLALVLYTNPLNAFSDMPPGKHLAAVDQRLRDACVGANISDVAASMRAWASDVSDKAGGMDQKMVWCEAHETGGNDAERTLRNVGYMMSRDMGADAVLVVEHDEMIEYAFTRDQLQRTLRHPNPLVRCFDVGVLYAWDAPTLVREDAPWGHGGTYQGGGHGPRLYRLQANQDASIQGGTRAGAVPDHGVAAHRVAAMRVHRFRYSRPVDRVKLNDSGEGMRISQWNIDNRIGMHMLVWRDEDPEDIARWLDQVHAVIDHAVLVWTDEWLDADKAWTMDEDLLDCDAWPDTGPGRALAMLAHLHGAEWVHEPLDDNIAQARNAGITALAERGGLAWAWFMDPDEWLGDPMADCITLRNMACSSRWGWLMQVANYRADKAAPTISDSVRISRLDETGVMRMNGRVHESFSMAIKQLQSQDIHPRLVYAPFVVQHRGMAMDAERMSAKLDKYDRLLRMQLDDNPNDPGSWVSLGWQYFNDGYNDEGLECYRRALSCAGMSYLPYKEMAYVHLREARDLMDKCCDRLAGGHQFNELAQHMRKWLNQYAPPHPVIARPDTWEDTGPEPLPEWAEVE